MGIELPILYTAIDRYAVRNGIDGEQFDCLLRFVSLIDDAYRDRVEEDRIAAIEEAKSKQGQPDQRGPN